MLIALISRPGAKFANIDYKLYSYIENIEI